MSNWVQMYYILQTSEKDSQYSTRLLFSQVTLFIYEYNKTEAVSNNTNTTEPSNGKTNKMT